VGTYQRDVSFGSWRHDPIGMATDFQTSSSWFNLAHTKRIVDTWGHQRKVQLSLSVPLWAGLGGKLTTAASGVHDVFFKQMAKNLVTAGLSRAILRIGWEFNESYEPWSVSTTAQAHLYAKAWRQIVRSVRSVKGEHFRFDWCPYNAIIGFKHPMRAYPGNKYVDYIGSDVYDWDQRGPSESAARRWHDLVHGRTGLKWQARVARRHHKQLSTPEWALVRTTLPAGHGGNDDPRFVRNMWRWFGHHHIAYEDYFDATGYTLVRYGLDTSSTAFPRSATVYRHLWSSRNRLR
jgi:Glycosyl hydrolase family 26